MGSPVARGRVSPQRRSRRGRGLSPWVWKPPWKRAYPGASPTEFGTYGKRGLKSESESQGVLSPATSILKAPGP